MGVSFRHYPHDREHAMGTDDSKQKAANRKGGHDWSALVTRIQERMFLSQLDIADRCGVARQTVSAWMNNRRAPGLYAKRALLELAAEAGVLDESEAPTGTVPGDRDELHDARQLHTLLKQMSEQAREEVLDFARFKIARERR
jgi:transcriptional regulator with XRE-family HTH domain